MKKIDKTPGPNALTDFARDCKDANWDAFRDHDGSNAYKEIEKLIFFDQGGLCAYCEEKPNSADASKKRIEHFHPKSDKKDPDKNWALDWDNVFGVCLGGEDADKKTHPRPANLSCDAYKNHMITKRELKEDCEGLLLNPLWLCASPCLFTLDKVTGKLAPNGIDFTNLAVTFEQVENTIKWLNLNCDRLNKQRLLILHEYEARIKTARKNKESPAIFRQNLAVRWFQARWPRFFTTRRILLAEYAEEYLFPPSGESIEN